MNNLTLKKIFSKICFLKIFFDFHIVNKNQFKILFLVCLQKYYIMGLDFHDYFAITYYQFLRIFFYFKDTKDFRNFNSNKIHEIASEILQCQQRQSTNDKWILS